MCDWFTFHVNQDAKMINIDINTQTLLETQPYDCEEADELCEDVLNPMIDDIRTVCIEKGYTQECTINLKDVDVTLMNPIVLSRIIWNIYEHSKNEPENLIQRFDVINSNSFFRGVYRVTKRLLPTYMINLITIS
jgi:hypothetical protein